MVDEAFEPVNMRKVGEGKMERPRIGIIGLGLIGGSLARRLVSRGVSVVAWNHRSHPYESAECDGIQCAATLKELVEATPEVLVLCNPLKAMPAILAELKPLLDAHPEVTLTDVGSVKGMVRQQVRDAGLAGCYVGAHPMAGNELSGWDAADPALFNDALWAATVEEGTDWRRFQAVARMIVEGVGNRLIVLDDDTHDRAAALISHMPHVVATALINELTANPDRNIAAALSAGSWRDMTRVALTDPQRTRAMVEEDSCNVEALLRSMAARLMAVADQLHCNVEVKDFFAEGQPFRDYKARIGGAETDTVEEHGMLTIPEEGWQQALLESARRGEQIVALHDERNAEVITRAM